MNAPRFWQKTARVLAVLWLFQWLAVPLGAAEAAAALSVVPRWQKGDQVRYLISKTRRQTKDAAVVLNTTTLTDVDIEVLSKTDAGYVLAWTLGETRFTDPALAKDPALQRMGNLLKGQRMLLALDAGGAITGVQNWKELQAAATKAVAAGRDAPPAAGLEPAALAQLQTPVAAMFATQEQVEQLCTREAQVLLMALNIALTPGQPVEYEDLAGNPFGGEPLPTRAQFALKAEERQGDQVTVTWSQTLKPEDARRIMERTLKAMAARAGQPVPEAAELLGFRLEESAEFVLELASGWVRRLRHTRTTLVAGATQEDELVITRKTP